MRTIRKAVTALTATCVALQPVMAPAADVFYYRHSIGLDGPGSGAPGNSVNVPDQLGTGTLAVLGPVQVRARPDVGFSLRLATRDAEGEVTWTSVGEPLPAGLSISGDGLISGKPMGTGKAIGVRMRAVDGAGRTGETRAFTVDVRPLPAVSAQGVSVRSGEPVAIAPTASDVYGSASWSLASGVLPIGVSLNQDTGALTGTAEQKGSFAGIVVQVVDADGAVGRSAPFAIEVASNLAVTNLKAAYPARLGRAIQPIRPAAAGAQGTVLWSVAPGSAPLPAGLSLDSATGAVTGSPTAPGRVAGVSLKAQDTATGETVASDPVTFTVAGPPAVSVAALTSGPVGEAMTVAPSASGILGSARWTLVGPLPEGMGFDAASGRLSGSPSRSGTHSGLKVLAMDLFDGARAESLPFSISVSRGTAAPLALRLEGPASVVRGASASLPAPTVTGADGAVSFALASGVLPEGMDVDPSTGILSGTPVFEGVHDDIVLRATDAAGATATSNPLSIVVTPSLGTNDAASASIPADIAAGIGERLAQAAVATNLAAPLAWSWRGAHPAWLTLDAATGEISGTPTETGLAEGLSLSVTDAAGKVARTNLFRVSVSDTVALSASAPATRDGVVGRPFLAAASASGVRGAASWSLGAGSLPPGLALDASNGRISGTPEFPGDADGLVLTVTDATGSASTAPFRIAISPAPTLSASMLPFLTAPAGSAFAVTPTVTGAVGARSWSLSAGSLPVGLGVDPANGQVFGSTSQVGTYEGLELRVSDASGASVSTNAFRIVVSTLSASGGTGSGGTGGTGGTGTGGTGSGGTGGGTGTGGSTGGGSTGGSTGGTGSGGTGAGGSGSGATGGSGVPSIGTNYTEGGVNYGSGTPANVYSPPGSYLYVSGFPGLFTAYLGRGFATGGPAVFGARGPITWSASGAFPGWLRLDPQTGSLYGTPDTLGAWGGLTLTASDGYGTSTLGPFAIQAVRPDFSAAGPGGTLYGHAGRRFASTAGRTTGSFGPVTWSVQGAIPPGIALDPATGVLSGTPTAPASVGGVALVARDGYDGRTDTTPAFAIQILGDPSIAVSASYPGRQGYPMVAAPTPRNLVGPVAWRIAAGTLPGWASLDARTGVVSGTPTAIGTVPGLRLGATDATGATAVSDPFSLAVGSGIAAASSQPAYASRVGVPFDTGSARATGASGAVSWELASGSLAGWARIVPGTGAVTGTPDAPGDMRISLRATDARGDAAVTQPFTVSALARPAIALGTVPPVRVGAPFSLVPTASDTTGTQSWTLTSGTLPAGLSFDGASGRISGRPQTVGTASGLAVQVRDGQGAVGTAGPFSIDVRPGPAIGALPSPYGGRAGAPFAMPPLTATNVLGTVSWAVANAHPGLSVKGAALDGVPSESGTRDVVVTAIDSSDDARASAPARIVVSPPLKVSSSPKDVDIHVGQGFSTSAPGIVGQRGAGLSWDLFSGTMPDASTLSEGTGIIASLRQDAKKAYLGLRLRARDPVDQATATTDPFNVTVHGEPAVVQVPTAYTARFGAPLTTSPPVLQEAAGAVRWEWGGGTPPAWAKVDGATGSVTGTPDAIAATRDLRLKATDGTGLSALSIPFALSVFVQPDVSIVPATTSYRLRPGDSVSIAPSVGGIAGTAGWSREGTPLPDGIGFDEVSGKVSGTLGPVAAAGVSSFVLVARDSADGATGRSPQVVLNTAPALALSGLKDAYVVRAGEFLATDTPVYSGNQGAVTFGLSIPVPAGMNPFDATSGVLSGAPVAAAAERTVTLTATDAYDGRSARRDFKLTVLGPLAFSTQPQTVAGYFQATANMVPKLANAIGTASFALYRNGVAAPAALSACTGLQFSTADGSITGVPSAACNVTNLTVVASDTSGATVTSSSFAVTAQNVTVTLSETTVSFFEGQTKTVQASSQLASPTWTISGAPNGSSVAANGTVTLYGSNVDADTNYSVTVTASANGASFSAQLAVAVKAAVLTITEPGPVRSGSQFRVVATSTGIGTRPAFSPSVPGEIYYESTGRYFYGTAPTYNGPDEFDTRTLVFSGSSPGPAGSTTATVSGSTPLKVYRNLAFAGTIPTVAGTVGSPIAPIQMPTPKGMVGTPSYETWIYTAYDFTTRQIVLSNYCGGLSLDNVTGIISGTPTGACQMYSGNRMFVRVRDNGGGLDNGQNGLRTYVDGDLPLNVPAATVSASPANHSVVEGSDVTITGTSSFQSPTWSLVGAPAFLTIDAATGVVTGTPLDANANNTYNFKLQASQGGASVQADASVTVNAGVAIARIGGTSVTSTSLQEGKSLNIALSGSYAGPKTYSFVSKPDWLNIDAATGAITGIAPDVASATTSTAVLRVTQNAGTPKAVSSDVSVAITVTAGTVPATYTTVRSGKTFGTPLSTTLTSAGTWTIVPDQTDVRIDTVTDPKLNTTTFLGTAPTYAGTGTITRNIATTFTTSSAPSAGSPAAATGIAQLTIYPALAYTSSPGSIGVTAGSTVNAPAPGLSGKVGTISYSLIRGGDTVTNLGTLCAGLSYSTTTGAITGTASGLCSLEDLRLRATDAAGSDYAIQTTVLTDPFSITVTDPIAAGTQPAAFTGFLNSTTTTQATVTGTPTGSMTWTLLGPDDTATSVPTWLTKAAGTCAATGTAAKSCTIQASPPNGTATGTYPATGVFKLVGTDGSGRSVAFNGFTVSVQAPLSAATIRPVSILRAGVVVPVGTLYDNDANTQMTFGARESMVFTYSGPVTVDTACMYLRSQGGNSMTFNVTTAEGVLSGTFSPTAAANNTFNGTVTATSGNSKSFTVKNETNNVFTVYDFKLGVGGACAN
jgi:hypothetical protein